MELVGGDPVVGVGPGWPPMLTRGSPAGGWESVSPPRGARARLEKFPVFSR